MEAIIYAAPECGDNWRKAQTQCPSPRPNIVFLKGHSYPGFSTIAIDNFLGGYLATKHLLESGCRHIAHISGPLDWWESKERLRGWKYALEEAGLPPTDRQLVSGNWLSSSGVQAMEKLLDVFPEMDGIFSGNDQMALGVLHGAHKVGIKVPQQLALVGFDDLDETPFYNPALTTIHQDLHQLGIMAVKKAIELVNNPENQGDIIPNSLILKPELIVRKSSQFQQE